MDFLSILELFFQLKPPNNKAEALLLLVHAKVVEKGFKTVVNRELSVMLPEDWNAKGVFEWSYKHGTEGLLLKAVKTDDELFVNLHVSEDDRTADGGAGFSLDDATTDFSHPKKAFRDLESISKKIDDELIEPILKKKQPVTGKPILTAGGRSTPPKDPLRVQQPRSGFLADDRWAYGRGDLDPLGRGGGGMIMDPFGRGRPDYEGTHGLPRGSVPPGARFDPVHPMNPDVINPPFAMPEPRQPPRGFGIPDPDHMQPPGYGDNFF